MMYREKFESVCAMRYPFVPQIFPNILTDTRFSRIIKVSNPMEDLMKKSVAEKPCTRLLSVKNIPETTKDLLSKAILVLLAVFLIELFFFNFASISSSFDQGTPSTPSFDSITDFRGAGLEKTENGDFLITSKGNTLSIEFSEVGQKLNAIALSLAYDADYIDVSMDLTDESNNSYTCRYGVINGRIYREDDGSRYISCTTTGKVDRLRINLTLPDKDAHISLLASDVTFNPDIPLDVSLFRILFLFVLIYGSVALLSTRVLGESVDTHPRAMRTATAAVILLCSLLGVYLCALQTPQGVESAWKLTTGNQMTKELVDAFRAGQLHLLDEVPESLLNMENPYDWGARSDAGISYKWDHLLYDGKYYSYYGIAPVLLLFLPYNLITGYYFPSNWAVCLFGVMGILFLGLLVYELIRRFFPKLSLGMYIGALILSEAVCGVWYCFAVTNFYEIAQAAGFGFVMGGLYFLLSSGVLGEGRIKLSRLASSATLLSLGVLSRPTEAVWCMVAVLILGFGLFKHLRENGTSKKTVLLYLTAALLPYVLLGSLQMAYNYLRFGSILDFGIQYSLTINDFTRADFSIWGALIAYVNFLFVPPSWSHTFPYIASSFTDLNINGYYFIANRNAVGLFFRALPACALFAAPACIRRVKEIYGRKVACTAAVIGSATAVVAPFAVLFSIWESGYGVRYCMDFFPEMLLVAIAIIALFYTTQKSEEARGLIHKAFLIGVILSLLVSFALYFDYFDANSDVLAFDLIRRLFTFGSF